LSRVRAIILTLVILAISAPAYAYVGPGAGFAFITSFFFLIATFFVALFSLAIWPIRFLFVWLRSRKAMKNAKVKRVVVLGLDGMDPDLAEQWMAEGHLPTFKKLAETGSFNRLATTYPAVSPVAWSSFMTGANPGRHNIYDFLGRDKKTYLPQLSSAYIGASKRTIKLGKYTIPLGKPELRLLRKSKTFWQVLGEHGIFSTIQRVPITFPPEKFNGVSLSGMCVPDIRGTQGTFSFYSTRKVEVSEGDMEGGITLPLAGNGEGYTGDLLGPPDALLDPAPEIKIPFTLTPNGNGSAKLVLPTETLDLKVGEFSEWVRLTFQASLRIKVNGIARFLVTELGDETSLYVTPINLDPEAPAFPISHPPAYGMYLSKLLGPYANLGLAEDTWVLNEGLLKDEQFVKQTYLIHEEREKMFFDALDKTRTGAVVTVFDDTDRIQHMFFRFLTPGHPAIGQYPKSEHENAIRDLYIWADGLLQRTLDKLGPKDALFVMSDHGFKAFKRGVNINTWLHENGYLKLKEGASGGKWLTDVDWSETRAYQVGLGGFYINMKGREAQGIVEPADADALIAELIEKLSGLQDTEKGETGINQVWAAKDIYTGPYVGEAPDLIVGYNVGYRAGWDATTGQVGGKVFTDNKKAWSGDHCMDPRKVPGVLFTNFPLDESAPAIIDIAPTVLERLGVEKPGYMDGRVLKVGK
jgi:predicted AlkP superfamily phosphohydrolase/phosphomutase